MDQCFIAQIDWFRGGRITGWSVCLMYMRASCCHQGWVQARDSPESCMSRAALPLSFHTTPLLPLCWRVRCLEWIKCNVCAGMCQLEDDVDVCPFSSSMLVHIGSSWDVSTCQRMPGSEEEASGLGKLGKCSERNRQGGVKQKKLKCQASWKWTIWLIIIEFSAH